MTGVFETWLLEVGLLTMLASLICCRALIMIAPKDAPDSERKPQTIAVPSSGGIAFGAVALSWAIYLVSVSASGCPSSECSSQAAGSVSMVWPHLGLFLGALILGGADDIFTLPAKPKFALLIALAFMAVSFGTYAEGIFLPHFDSYVIIASWIGIGGSALWIFVMMNATNFMDGSNGLSLGTLSIMIAAISLALYGQANEGTFDKAQFGASIFGALTVAAILGFLFWNLQGRLYAGDAGSLFGGAVFASLGIYAAQDGNIWFPATLALPILVDVFMTLLWRARRGHNLLTPHRHHAYQLLIRSGWGHIKTALLWWALGVLCAGSALWAAADSKSMSAWMFFGLLGAGCLLWYMQRRHFRDLSEQ